MPQAQRAASISLAIRVLPLLVATAPAHGWPLGQWTVDAAADATLRIDASSTVLRGTPSAGTPSANTGANWTLAVTPEGPRLSARAQTHCNGALFATAASWDSDGDGRINLASGDRLRVYVAATMRVPVARSWLAAITIDTRGDARLLWSVDDRSLPALGTLVVPPTVVRRPTGDPARPLREFLIVGTGLARTEAAATPAPAPAAVLALDADDGRPVAMPFDPRSRVPGGITAIDVDADGDTDRLYFADASHRVWQLAFVDDRPFRGLETRAREVALLGAGIDSDAALVHAPDAVTARDADGVIRWQLTVGTSDLPDRRASAHWLFHFDEPAVGAPPIDLVSLPLLAGAPSDADGLAHGYRLRLPAPLSAPTLTVDGRLLVASASTASTRSCSDGMVEREAATVLAIDRRNPSMPIVARRTRPVEVDAPLQAGWSIDAANGDGGRLLCRLGDEALAECPAIPRVQRRWWTRSDAP